MFSLRYHDLLSLQASRLTCPACIFSMETPRPKPGPTSRLKCRSTSPTYTPYSTSHISPGTPFCFPKSHRIVYVLDVRSLVISITHTSSPRYWLWYTTQRFVCGGVRKVYQKLKQFKVQFLVLQRKTDPSQVMLQCLPSNKVQKPFCSYGFPLCVLKTSINILFKGKKTLSHESTPQQT